MHDSDNSVQRLTRPFASQGHLTAMTNAWPKLQDLRPRALRATTAAAHEAALASNAVARVLTDNVLSPHVND